MKCITRIDFSGFKDYIVESDKGFNAVSCNAQELFYKEIPLGDKFNIDIDQVWMTEINTDIKDDIGPQLHAFYKGTLYNVSCLEYKQNYAALWKLMPDGEYKYFTINISEIEKLIIDE